MTDTSVSSYDQGDLTEDPITWGTPLCKSAAQTEEKQGELFEEEKHRNKETVLATQILLVITVFQYANTTMVASAIFVVVVVGVGRKLELNVGRKLTNNISWL